MKTYNYTFQNNNLSDLIDYSLFKSEKNIFIQIFCGHGESTLELISNYLCKNIPHAICIGTTTDGEINDSTISTMNTIISISVFEKTFIKAHLIHGDNCFKDGYEIAKKVITNNTKLLITFTDGTSTNAEEYLKGIEEYNNQIIVCGGMAGDNGVFKQTFVSLGTQIISKGYVAVSLNSDILEVNNGFKFDWIPIGLEHTIDKIDGNRIYSISGMKPIDFYKKYLGESVTQTEFPLIVEKNGISTARAVLKQHKDGTLSCGGNLKEGDKVKLGFGDAESIMQDPRNAFLDILQRPVETFYIYSCMARRRYMRDLIRLETEPLSNIATTSGFFTYAEFYHQNGHNELLNQTLTVVSLSEIQPEITYQKIKIDQKDNYSRDASFAKTMKSLTNLVHQSTLDYQEQSKNLKESQLYSQRLLKSQKQFLKHAVHETNTPLSVIMGNIELYEMENGKNKYLTNIEVALKNLFSIYDDLSYLVKKDQIEYPRYEIDLVDYVRSRIDFFSQVANKKNSKFIFKAPKEKILIFFNESKLQRIIDNNLTNAIKYTYENKNIYITLKKEKEILKFLISSHSKKIQEPKKIFQEYYREEKSKDGFGLGLNLVKRICDEEDIDIYLESNEYFTSFAYIFKGGK
ncbi:MAG: diguanylate cyclase [Arcobacter sp.]|nr:diguanylate cyclase [Arcobacter sp.]